MRDCDPENIHQKGNHYAQSSHVYKVENRWKKRFAHPFNTVHSPTEAIDLHWSERHLQLLA